MPQPQKKTGLCVNSLIRSELALVSLRMLRAWLLSGFFLGGGAGRIWGCDPCAAGGFLCGWLCCFHREAGWKDRWVKDISGRQTWWSQCHHLWTLRGGRRMFFSGECVNKHIY